MTSAMGTTTGAYQGNCGRVRSSLSTSGPKVLMDYGPAAEDFRLKDKELSNQNPPVGRMATVFFCWNVISQK